MKKDTRFAQFVTEDLLAEIPGIKAKPMFGGHGIYKEGIIFAIIAEGQLYFKVDEQTEGEYKKLGSSPFTYTMPNKKPMTMSYWLLPADIMESRSELSLWVNAAVMASKRAKEGRKK